MKTPLPWSAAKRIHVPLTIHKGQRKQQYSEHRLRNKRTLLHQPSLFHRVEEGVHQVIAVILGNLEWLFLDAVIQTLHIHSNKQWNQVWPGPRQRNTWTMYRGFCPRLLALFPPTVTTYNRPVYTQIQIRVCFKCLFFFPFHRIYSVWGLPDLTITPQQLITSFFFFYTST